MKSIRPSRQRRTQCCAIVVHGGAAALHPSERNSAHRVIVCDALEQAVRAGHAVLSRRGSALDAVQAAVIVLEDAACLNAGRGSVLNARGEIELEASIMSGSDRRAGAVTGLASVKNPVLLARALMDRTPNVMLGFTAAEDYARELGLAMMPAEYFKTPERAKSLALEQRLERRRSGTSSAPAAPSEQSTGHSASRPTLRTGEEIDASIYDRSDPGGGTVGAVALDIHGDLAAATSTGGRTNKWPGRIGDSPIIGAGTYADNRACAVSATGHGEYFMRATVAHEIVARVRHRGEALRVAASHVVMRELVSMGGLGGVIAIDRAGSIAMPFNTGAMNRAVIDIQGRLVVAIERATERRATLAAP